MILTQLILEIFLMILHVSNCQRRIQDGRKVTVDKSYVVYLLKASISPQYYDGWTCGGALVSMEFVITSAACVTDVMHLYVIAGYSTYVPSNMINMDPCTKEKKKKVVLVCTPSAYELKYEELEKWSFIDIAVIKVESPYDFEDDSYSKICSYQPSAIEINLEQKYQDTGLDSIIFGWGHNTSWRLEDDFTDYNSQTLQYAPTLIQDKEQCKEQYKDYNGMDVVIDKYMICTFGDGNINDAGEVIQKSPANAQGCSPQQQKLRGVEPSTVCEGDNGDDDIVLIDNERRFGNETVYHHINPSINKSLENITYKINEINSTGLDFRKYNTRRNGICQNDHGGPLVTWVGSHEVLIGIASVFKIDEERKCIGPFLYTSTQCNGAFLNCILNESKEGTRRDLCDSPASVKGFELIKTVISWKSHPDGPAENEKENVTNVTKTSKTKPNKTNTGATTKNLKINITSKSNFTTNDPNITETLNITFSTTKNLHNVTTLEVINNTSYITNITSANVKTIITSKSNKLNYPKISATTNSPSSTTKNLNNTTLKVVNGTYPPTSTIGNLKITLTVKSNNTTKDLNINATTNMDTATTKNIKVTYDTDPLNTTAENLKTTLKVKSNSTTKDPKINATTNMGTATTESLKVMYDTYPPNTTIENLKTTLKVKSNSTTEDPKINATTNTGTATTETLKVMHDTYPPNTTIEYLKTTIESQSNITTKDPKNDVYSNTGTATTKSLKVMYDTYPSNTTVENLKTTIESQSNITTKDPTINVYTSIGTSTNENIYNKTTLRVINDTYSITTTMKIFNERKTILTSSTNTNHTNIVVKP